MRYFKTFILLIILALSFTIGCTSNTIGPEKDIIENDDNVEIEEKEESKGIPGSHYIDIKLGLEQNGFKETSLKYTYETGFGIYENIRKDELKGVSYYCCVMIENDKTISSADFEITNLNGLEEKEFLKLAGTYLTYCGSMPYDTNEISRSNEWIEKTIPIESEESCLGEILIGDAKFTMHKTNYPSGITGTILMTIEKL